MKTYYGRPRITARVSGRRYAWRAPGVFQKARVRFIGPLHLRGRSSFRGRRDRGREGRSPGKTMALRKAVLCVRVWFRGFVRAENVIGVANAPVDRTSKMRSICRTLMLRLKI